MDKVLGVTADSKGTNTLTNNGTVTYAPGMDYYDGALSRWYDNSGKGAVAGQTTLTKRPAWQSGILHGMPGVRFDAVDDALSIALDQVGTGDLTAWAVFLLTGWGGASAGTLVENQKFLFRPSAGTYIQVASDYATVIHSAVGSIALGVPYVVVVTRSAAGLVNIYINGQLSGIANQFAGTPVAGSDTFLGNRSSGDRGLDGYSFEQGLGKVLLSPPQAKTLSRWLGAKWGIGVVL
jgi:hypothetical protein